MTFAHKSENIYQFYVTQETSVFVRNIHHAGISKNLSETSGALM